jgi:cysteine desulfurase
VPVKPRHYQWCRYNAESTLILSLIYLDNNATTQPRQEVVEALAEAEARFWANSASPHRLGQDAKSALEEAKQSLASNLGCRASELVITSGATEANNLALAGVFDAETFRRQPRRRILVSAIEHPSVLEAAEALEARGAVIDQIEVDTSGLLNLSDMRSKLTQDTLLVSVMAANNEVGTLQPIAEVAEACHQVGAYFHTDATQWLGRMPVNLPEWGVDLLSASAHKLHGPKGVGLLFVRSGLPLSEQQHGGGHQGGKRSGTVNVPGAVAFAHALQAADDQSDWESVQALRERLYEGLVKTAGPIERISPKDGCLPNTLNLRFNGVDSESIMASAPTICCSPGSACSHATPAPSHVLIAMGLDRKAAGECLRFSLSQATTRHEIDQAIKILAEASSYVRSMFEDAA